MNEVNIKRIEDYKKLQYKYKKLKLINVIEAIEPKNRPENMEKALKILKTDRFITEEILVNLYSVVWDFIENILSIFKNRKVKKKGNSIERIHELEVNSMINITEIDELLNNL